MEIDKPFEKCGIVGMIDPKGKEVVRRTIAALVVLHHRGDDSAGILTLNNGYHLHKGWGFANDIFNEDSIREYQLEGDLALGHTRYENQGGQQLEFSGPFIAEYEGRSLGLSHNGNDNNLQKLEVILSSYGLSPKPKLDSNYLAHLIVSADGTNWVERVQNGLLGVEGSYSLVILTDDKHLIGVRDPWGNRPLSWARSGSSFIIASETVAFDEISATDWREFEPGQIIDISRDGIYKSSLLEEAKGGRCIFEKIYLSYHTSVMDGETVAQFRKRLGEKLADRHFVPGGVVTAIPDSAIIAANAYAQRAGKTLEVLVAKKRLSVKRSFMQGEIDRRKGVAERKFNISPDVEGRVIITVDDSTVAGTTQEIMNRNLRRKGAKKIHSLNTSAEIYKRCIWGVNFLSRNGEFIAWNQETGKLKSHEEIAKDIGADTVDFLKLDELYEVISEGGLNPEEYCFYCVGGEGLQKATLKPQRPKIEPFYKLINID